MNTFLVKTEPSEYSFASLQADGSCCWDGVSNAGALIALRRMKKGDRVFIYHTGEEKAIVGMAIVTGSAYDDPAIAPERTPQNEPRHAVVDLKPLKAASTPMTLAQCKKEPAMSEFALVRQGRLSVMEVPPAIAALIRKHTGL